MRELRAPLEESLATLQHGEPLYLTPQGMYQQLHVGFPVLVPWLGEYRGVNPCNRDLSIFNVYFIHCIGLHFI